MTTKSKSTAKFWLMFLISMVALVLFLIFLPEWCWVTFPFVFTSLVYAFDWL